MINIFQPDSESGALSYTKRHHTIMKFRIQMIRSYRAGFGPNSVAGLIISALFFHYLNLNSEPDAPVSQG